jgi:hypothetical protein
VSTTPTAELVVPKSIPTMQFSLSGIPPDYPMSSPCQEDSHLPLATFSNPATPTRVQQP